MPSEQSMCRVCSQRHAPEFLCDEKAAIIAAYVRFSGSMCTERGVTKLYTTLADVVSAITTRQVEMIGFAPEEQSIVVNAPDAPYRVTIKRERDR